MIRVKTFLACLMVLALPAVASAGTSFYGTLACSEADPPPNAAAKKVLPAKKATVAKNGSGVKSAAADKQSTAADSKPDPAAAVAQEKCSWTLPLQIGNDTVQDGENTIDSTITGVQSKDTGTHVTHMTNADQFTLSLSGSTVWDADGAARIRQGVWKFTNGTGMLKGITGSGTYYGLPRAQGGMSYDVEGDYEFPASPVASPPPAAASSSKAASPS